MVKQLLHWACTLWLHQKHPVSHSGERVEEWALEHHSYSHSRATSTTLFIVGFIHILQLPLLFMWGTTSRSPTPTTAFIIADCCLATDKGTEFWGGWGGIKGVGEQIKSNIKMLSLSIHPKVSQHSGQVCTHTHTLLLWKHCSVFYNYDGKQDLFSSRETGRHNIACFSPQLCLVILTVQAVNQSGSLVGWDVLFEHCHISTGTKLHRVDGVPGCCWVHVHK